MEMFNKEPGQGMPVRHIFESSWPGLRSGQRDQSAGEGGAGLVGLASVVSERAPSPLLMLPRLSGAPVPTAGFAKTSQPCFPGRRTWATVLPSHGNTKWILGHGGYHPFSRLPWLW